MPIIPRVEPKGGPPAIRLPRATAEDFGASGFEAIAQLGQVLGKIAQSRSQGEALRIRNEASVMADRGFIELEKTSDHTNFLDNFGELETSVRDAAGKQSGGLMKSHAKALDQDLDLMLGRARNRAIKQQTRLEIQHERATGLTSLKDVAAQAARATDPEERRILEAVGRTRIESMRFDNVLNDVEAVVWEDRFEKQIQEQRQQFFDGELQDRLTELSVKATRDSDNAPEYQREGFNLIDDATADWLPREKQDEIKNRFQQSLWHGAVKTRIDEDPEDGLEDLKAGVYDKVLSQSSFLGLRGQAEGEIEKQKRKAEAQRKEQDRFVGKLVSDYEDAKSAGFEWEGPVSEGQLSELVKGTEHEVKFQNITQASSVLAKFNQLRPSEQEQVLRQGSTGAKTGFEAKFFSTLERAHEVTKRELSDDPLTFAIKQKVIPPPPPLELSNADALPSRSKLAGIVSQHYGVPASPLTDTEAEQLSTELENAPADARVVLFRQLSAGLEDRHIKAVAGQLTKKGDAVVALSMGISSEAPLVASGILRGKDILRDNPKILPSGAELTAARGNIAELLGDAYRHNPAQHAAVRDAALNLYAFKSWQERDLSAIFDSDRMEKSIDEVTGGLLTIDRGFFAESFTIQPPKRGMTEDDFMEMLKQGDYSDALGFTPEAVQRHGIFESVGDGKYLVRVGPGYVQAVGGPFILDLSEIEPKAIGRKISVEVERLGESGAL